MEKKNIIDDWYSNHYNLTCVSAKNGYLANYQHKLLEKTSPKSAVLAPKILEIGTNKGEHIPFVKKNFAHYVASDIRNSEYFQVEEEIRHKTEFVLANAELLPFEDESFDRVIMTCVLHHLENPEAALSEMRRVLCVGGSLSLWLPHDPGVFYRLLRKFTSVRKARKLKIDKQLELVHALEHRNHFLSLKVIIENTFANDEIDVFRRPFKVASYNLNIVSVYQIRKMDRKI